MATILERNKNKKMPKKSRQEAAEDALFREVWEDVNNEKTMKFLKKYYRYIVYGILAILLVAIGIQVTRHQIQSSRKAAANNYEMALYNMDAQALAGLGKGTSGATSDLALFQSFMLDGDVSKLEYLVKNGSTRDFRDLARIHLAGIQGDDMDAKSFEKFMAPLNTKKSPYYYNSLLLVAQKYLADGDKATANVWLDKIITDKDAPAVFSGTAQTLK